MREGQSQRGKEGARVDRGCKIKEKKGGKDKERRKDKSRSVGIGTMSAEGEPVKPSHLEYMVGTPLTSYVWE